MKMDRKDFFKLAGLYGASKIITGCSQMPTKTETAKEDIEGINVGTPIVYALFADIQGKDVDFYFHFPSEDEHAVDFRYRVRFGDGQMVEGTFKNDYANGYEIEGIDGRILKSESHKYEDSGIYKATARLARGDAVSGTLAMRDINIESGLIKKLMKKVRK